MTLVEPLPEALQSEITSLWDEYEAATSREAKLAKALDKLETILQHNRERIRLASTTGSTSAMGDGTRPTSR